jgi:thiamine pyrophosphokinase
MRFGGVSGLARLYLEAGLLYLEGVADTYLPRSYTDTADGDSTLTTTAAEAAAESEKWKQEKETARRLFDRARMLDPHLDIPTLPADEPDLSKSELRMPDVSIDTFGDLNDEKPRRRRRKAGESMVEQASRDSREGSEDSDGTWYVWLPGIIGAGTALLAVGLIGAMSIGSWRKSQNS